MIVNSWDALQVSKLTKEEQSELLDQTMLYGANVVKSRFPGGKILTFKQGKMIEYTLGPKKRVSLQPSRLPGLPPPSIALPEQHNINFLAPRVIRVRKLVLQSQSNHNAFAQFTDTIFSSLGLGEQSRTSAWKLRIDRAHGAIAEVLREIKEHNELR